MCGQASALGGCGLVEDLAHLLGAVVGDFDTDMRLFAFEGVGVLGGVGRVVVV